MVTGHGSLPSKAPRLFQSLHSGPTPRPIVCSSFTDFFNRVLNIHSPLPADTVPRSEGGTWSISAPEFDDAPLAPIDGVAPVFSSFGEFASAVLGVRSPSPIRHFSWTQKPPFFTVHPLSASQVSMAYQLVDPAPFMPQGAQRLIIPNRPLMKKVHTGVIQARSNDLAIAIFNPAPLQAVNFEDIRNVLVDFLTVQNDFPYTTIQRCPYGQAYVRFAYHHHRDFLIHGSPHQVDGGFVSFIPHNRA